MDLIRYLVERGHEPDSMRSRRHRRRFSESAATADQRQNQNDSEDENDLRTSNDTYERNMNILDMLTNMQVQNNFDDMGSPEM